MRSCAGWCVRPKLQGRRLILSEIPGIFSDMGPPIDKTQVVDRQIQRRIYGAGRSSVFTPTQFLALGGRAAVDKALSRLTEASTVEALTKDHDL